MHDDDIRRGDLTTALEDEIMQRSVLTQILVLHPAQLTILELALRAEADRQVAGQDAVERAVRELSRDGLVKLRLSADCSQPGCYPLRGASWGRLMSLRPGGVRDLKGVLGENLARCRRRTGLSQEEVAWRASLHRTEISQLERGLRLARADTILKLASALEIPVADLFEGLAWEPGDVRRGRFVGNAED